MNISESLSSLEKQYLIASYRPIEAMLAEYGAELKIEGKKLVFDCQDQESAFQLKTSYVDLMLFIDRTPSLHNLESVAYRWPGGKMCCWQLPLRRT